MKECKECSKKDERISSLEEELESSKQTSYSNENAARRYYYHKDRILRRQYEESW